MMLQLEEQIILGDRPPIPKDTPKEITTIIEDTWKGNSEERPTMGEVLCRLERVCEKNFGEGFGKVGGMGVPMSAREEEVMRRRK